MLEPRFLLTTYYVSTGGSNANPGTSINQPMATIQQAVNAALAGDTVLIRGGTYRETVSTPRSGTALSRITIQNYQNETVTVSGTDVITGSWTSVGNEVYRAPMPWNYQFENQSSAYNSNQVFVGGKEVELARWPTQISSDVVMPTLAIADNVTFSKSDPNLASNDLATFHEVDFTDNPNRWVGAKIWANLARNDMDGQGQTGEVVSATNGSITVKGIDTKGGNQPWGIGTGTEFYLFQPTLTALNNSGGIAAGLDRGEWFLDTAAQQLYVRTPTGAAPTTGSVEAKRRTFGFNFDGDSHLTLQGVNLFGTSLTTDTVAANRNESPGGVAAASNILIDSMNARYVTHFTDMTGNYQMQWLQKSGLVLSGTDITFQNGDIRLSAGSGISILGRQNKVLNSVFKDLNLSASEAGMVNFGKTYDPSSRAAISEDHEFGYNTMSNSPQQGINFRALKNSTGRPDDVRARIHHNVIHDVMLRSADSAAIDSFGGKHQYVRIDHNVIYNVNKNGRCYGIYFDYSGGGIVDHNVVYNVRRPININWADDGTAQNMRIYNNVALSDLSTGAGIDTGARQSFGSIIQNNILSNGIFAGGYNGSLTTPLTGATVGNNLVSNNNLFIDPTNANLALRNYQLTNTATTAIDKGVSVSPYDDVLADGPDADTIAQPDIGAYEYSVAPWTAGAGQITVPLPWSISGVAYRDGNRNGTRDAGEGALAGRTVFLDRDNNGLFSVANTATYTSSESAVPIPDNNTAGAQRTVSVPAAIGAVTKVTVKFSLTHPRLADLIGYLIAPDGTTVTLFSINKETANITDMTFEDGAATPVSGGSAPYTGTFRTNFAVLGTFIGRQSGGTWRLKVVDSATGNTGSITAFAVTISTAGDLAATTAADGSYSFPNLSSRNYTVRQVVPSNWSTVSPASGDYAVALTAGTSVLNRDFGSYESSTPAVTASASPTSVTAKTTTLQAAGTDANGEANLSYTWSLTSGPTAVTFGSTNGTNAAKSLLATFARAGSYTFSVVAVNAAGTTSAASSVTVTVAQTLTAVSVSPGSALVPAGAQRQFAASATDQFGDAMSATFTWSATGGSIDSSGLYTAGATPGSGYGVTATSGGLSATASVEVTAPADTVAPRVTGVWVGSSAWSSSFTDALGSSYGYAVPAGSGQLAALP
ncbi:MAG TPA: proprotein convertase P-domain-containing protein, partial [Tepidisphaeraceae bacterium]